MQDTPTERASLVEVPILHDLAAYPQAIEHAMLDHSLATARTDHWREEESIIIAAIREEASADPTLTNETARRAYVESRKREHEHFLHVRNHLETACRLQVRTEARLARLRAAFEVALALARRRTEPGPTP